MYVSTPSTHAASLRQRQRFPLPQLRSPPRPCHRPTHRFPQCRPSPCFHRGNLPPSRSLGPPSCRSRRRHQRTHAFCERSPSARVQPVKPRPCGYTVAIPAEAPQYLVPSSCCSSDMNPNHLQQRKQRRNGLGASAEIVLRRLRTPPRAPADRDSRSLTTAQRESGATILARPGGQRLRPSSALQPLGPAGISATQRTNGLQASGARPEAATSRWPRAGAATHRARRLR